MNRANLFLIVGLAGGTVLGLLASGSLGGFGSGSSPKNASPTDGMAHDHSKMIDATDPVPTVQIALFSEGGCSYNLQTTVQNFAFSPSAVNTDHNDGEGHAHLYVDGKKIARLYSEWFHFTVPQGSKTAEVVLNSNDHSTLANGGEPIGAKADLTDC